MLIVVGNYGELFCLNMITSKLILHIIAQNSAQYLFKIQYIVQYCAQYIAQI